MRERRVEPLWPVPPIHSTRTGRRLSGKSPCVLISMDASHPLHVDVVRASYSIVPEPHGRCDTTG
jgi:hypothetical protein